MLLMEAVMLKEGEVVRYGTKAYRVQMVSQSRAFLVPIAPGAQTDDESSGATDPDDDRPVKPRQQVKGINVSPNSVLPTVTEEELRQPQPQSSTARPSPTKQEVVPSTEESREVSPMAGAAIPFAATKKAPVAGKTVAGIPGVGTARAADNARRAGLAAKKDAKAEARARANKEAGIGTKNGTGKLAAAKAAKAPGTSGGGKAPKQMKPCLCGCGEQTASYFCMGHDARFKGWMIKVEQGKMTLDELRKLSPSVVKAYEFKKKGPGFVTTHNYKGEKHGGYSH